MLANSWIWSASLEQEPPPFREARATLPLVSLPESFGPGRCLACRFWPVQAGAFGPARAPNPVPVILLHGSPGGASDFNLLAPLLRDRGYRVLAFDLPGFGDSPDRSFPDLSTKTGARAVLGAMDTLHIPRAHILGWSLGGAVAINIADLAPDRVASLTLLASVSDQQGEGSGSYWYEHAKYATGYAIATVVRFGVPHFGLLSEPLDTILASMRNFWDTDMRPLHDAMLRLRTPTLILHGRDDFLAPIADARRSHELIAPSSLVVIGASHFIPFLQAEEAATVIEPFLRRHDGLGVPAIRYSADLAPALPALGPAGAWAAQQVQRSPYWLVIIVLALGVSRWPRRTAATAGVLVGFVLVDFGVAAGGLLAGQCLLAGGAVVRGRRLRRRTGPSVRAIGAGLHARPPHAWLELLRAAPIRSALAMRFVPREHELAIEAAAYGGRAPPLFLAASFAAWLAWTFFFLITGIAAAGLIAKPLARECGAPGLIIGTLVAVWAPISLSLMLTRHGRRRLRIAVDRALRREYWPAPVQYALLLPLLARLGLRHGAMAFTCCNPGISGGGGIIGESKKAILDAIGPTPEVLAAELIAPQANPAARAAALTLAIAQRPELGGFPIILKPDEGQRGFAVKLVRSPADAGAYFRAVRSPVIAQRYHPGPCECGILWARTPEPDGSGLTGRIFSITRKEFPVLVGDGRRTFEQLIHAHPRFRRQAAVFLERFAPDRERLLPAGEPLRLAESGNHCQGTLFTDGADLITPALERAIDALARGFKGGLDIGRFDIRYESDESLRRGEGFAVVELNGTAGESTNIYDPGRSIFWAYRVLAAQWTLLYELGAARRRQGAHPLSLLALWRETRRHVRERSGSAVAD